jgi:serine acetyltransferase
MSYLLQQGRFVLRTRYLSVLRGAFRKSWFSFFGMKIGRGTALPPMTVTWPHQVSIGSGCSIEKEVYFKFDGIWRKGPSIIIGNHVFIGTGCEFNIRAKIIIGDDCLIASGCRFIDHDHGVSLAAGPMRGQWGVEKEISIGSDVWLGCNVIVLKGVVIEDGAVIAAGAVVTKHISKNEIWGGIPARKIGERPL